MYQKFINSLYISFIIILISFSARSAEDPKSIGKFKDWETFTVTENDNKICFAQSIPILRAPKKFERNPSRLFISFRPSEDIKDEVSATSGYTFQKENIVKADQVKLDESNSDFTVMGKDDMKIVKGLESTIKIDCEKCHNQEGVWWTFQTRSADEPETKFYRCTKCNHTWRDYT